MQDQNMWWVVGLIILFMMGSIAGLRVSPREKALGQLREKARKLGLQPRLVPAPAWAKVPSVSENRAAMVAYYFLVIPTAQFVLLRAVNQNGHWHVVEGQSPIDQQPIPLNGIYALEQQANSIGFYWDESQDFDGQQLEKLQQYLHSFAQQAAVK